MISDFDSNTVYFSKKLTNDPRFKDHFEDITSILRDNHVPFRLLENTRDIWARDYMPIQVSKDKFIEYRYDPDYLQAKKWRKYKSYPDIICDELGIKTIKTDLIIDGGNVIKSSDCVIMTDKVLVENIDHYTPEQTRNKLKELFEVDRLALIPWEKGEDKYGHADGMLRFIDKNTVLLQGFYEEAFLKKILEELERNDLNWKVLKYDVESLDERNWAYINFLQTKDIILMTKFGIEEDQQAFNQIQKHFPAYKGKIKQVDISNIVAEDGALNCISWTTA